MTSTKDASSRVKFSSVVNPGCIGSRPVILNSKFHYFICIFEMCSYQARQGSILIIWTTRECRRSPWQVCSSTDAISIAKETGSVDLRLLGRNAYIVTKTFVLKIIQNCLQNYHNVGRQGCAAMLCTITNMVSKEFLTEHTSPVYIRLGPFR
jgi:hypothetical protein